MNIRTADPQELGEALGLIAECLRRIRNHMESLGDDSVLANDLERIESIALGLENL